MNFYDSSILVKVTLAESGSLRAAQLYWGAHTRDRSLSALATVEVRSAIERRKRMKQISPRDYIAAVRSSELVFQHSQRLAIDGIVLDLAVQLVQRRGLRSLDAIQLASALILRDTLLQPVTFICADKNLILAAQEEGLLVIRPEQP